MAKSSMRSVIASGVVVIAAFSMIAWLLGFPIDATTVFVLSILFAGVAFAARRGADLQVGFVVIGIGILLVINEYLLPQIVSEAFSPIHGIWMAITGINLGEIEPLRLTILIVAGVFVMIYLRVRLSGEKKFANTAADKTLAELANYARRYISIGRVTVFFLFSILVLLMSQASELLGEIGNVMAGAPVIVSNLWAVFIGFAALDGELPGIGEVPFFVDIGATGFFILAVIGLAIAVATRWESSGPLSQMVKNR